MAQINLEITNLKTEIKTKEATTNALYETYISEEEELHGYKQKMACNLMKLQADSFYKKQSFRLTKFR
jgi:hypothetical protein